MKTNPNALSKEQAEILNHTLNRATGQRYCGDSAEMQDLCRMGLMESVGRASWCPDEYFTITSAGRKRLAELNKEEK